MRVELFDFDLPQDLIALRPASPRDHARMLVVEGQGIFDRQARDLPDFVRAGDVIVLNDTKVFPAELKGHRPPRDPSQGGRVTVHLSLHKQVSDDVWAAFARPARRLRLDDKIQFGSDLHATVISGPQDGEVRLKFDKTGAALFTAFHEVGAPPLPPYILSKRQTDAQDETDYQTVFAEHEGSVAAPTAGLHFTDDLLQSLEDKGVRFARVTLHVGAGTFLPMKVDDTDDHKMHAEWGSLSAETAQTINEAKAKGQRIICVGTTSLRLLESAVEPDGTIMPFAKETDIFITPGYSFKSADMLMTNFHLPKSTLFMLVSAFAGMKEMKAAYAHAISNHYRFYSYGDASLLYRQQGTEQNEG